MGQVYISCHPKDGAWVERFADALSSEGFDLYWDANAVDSVWDLSTEAARKFAEAEAVIVVWSAEALSEEVLRSQANEARKDKLFYQVLREPVGLSPVFQSKFKVDLSDWDFDPQRPAFRTLAVALRQRVKPVIRPIDSAKKPIVIEEQAVEAEEVVEEERALGLTGWILLALFVALAAVYGFQKGWFSSQPAHGKPQSIVPQIAAKHAPIDQFPTGDVDLLKNVKRAVDSANEASQIGIQKKREVEALAKDITDKFKNKSSISGKEAFQAHRPPQVWSYTGDLDVRGLPDGEGTKILQGCPKAPNAQRLYQGQFRAGAMEGLGKLQNCGLSVYLGDRTRDKANGYGFAQDKTGTYSGMFGDGIPSLGIKTYAPGADIARTIGQQGLRGLDGFGQLDCSDGTLWRARWSGGKPLGVALRYSANGKLQAHAAFTQADNQAAVMCALSPRGKSVPAPLPQQSNGSGVRTVRGPTGFSCSAPQLYLDEKAICGNDKLTGLEAEMTAAYKPIRARTDSKSMAMRRYAEKELLLRHVCGSDSSCIASILAEEIETFTTFSRTQP